MPLGLYKEFQRATVYPLFRALPIALVSEHQSTIRVGGTELSVVLDNFTGADGVEAIDVFRAVKEFSRLERIESIAVAERYSESPLLQAADVVAWAGNRWITKNLGQGPDPPFRSRFGPLLNEARTLSDTRVVGGIALPPGVGMTTLCIPYSLARSAVHKKHPAFVDEVLVSVEEFHARAMHSLAHGRHGVSVLTTEGQSMADALLKRAIK